MKRTALCVMISLCLLNLKSHAQQISFSGNAVRLESFFSFVTKQTGYVFFYNATLLGNTQSVSIELNNVTLDSAMRAVLKNQPFTYDIQGKTIFVTPVDREHAESFSINTPLLQKIKGRIVDPTGMAIAGASVYARNSNASAMTNSNGEFQLTMQSNDSLTVTCIGYKKEVIGINSHSIVVKMQSDISSLDQVVVGGNLFAQKRKADISSVTVIDSKTLQTLPVLNIAEIYRGLVPGTNSFATGDNPQGNYTLTIRGAGSETSLTPISVYIDGVEWAGGSGYLSALNKENIERIEILRGPESSTLYGTGSNGGIVLIYTKKVISDMNSLSASAGAGFIQSKYVPGSAFQQYYTLDKQIGFKNGGIQAGGTYQTNGAWLPGGGEKTGTAHLNVHRDMGKKFSADLTGYYAGTSVGVSKYIAFDTVTHLSDSLQQYYGVSPRKLTNKKAEVRSYIMGLNLIYKATASWTHQLTIGYSQNKYHETAVAIPDTAGRTPDNFYQSVNKAITIRYSNLLNLGKSGSVLNANIMTGAEYKNLFYESKVTGTRLYILSGDPANSNWGAFTQINTSYKNVYLTAGLRYDYNTLFGNNHSLNPRIGMTTHFTVSELMIKPRLSWGRGITAPSYEARFGFPSNGITIGIPNPYIKPQEQSGFDYAIEFYDKKNRFSAEVVYYDNTLKNTFVENELPDANGLYVFQYTNVGAIANRGWEFSARYRIGSRLTLNGTFSVMQSVVKDSTGDYMSSQLSGKAPGDPLKFLPRHTTGLYVTWQFLKLFRKKDNGSISLNMTEVDGVLAYDGIRLSTDLAYGRLPAYTQAASNAYWVTSGTLFKVGIYVDYSVSNAFQFFAQGSNILNQKQPELTSDYGTSGAIWLFGIKFFLAQRHSIAHND